MRCTEIYQLAKAHPEGINSDMVIKADPREYYIDVTGKINAMIDEGLLMCVWEGGPKPRIIPNPDYNGKYCESYGIERRDPPKKAQVTTRRNPQLTMEAFL